MPAKSCEINFLDSYKADTKVVPHVIDCLIRDLKECGYPNEDVDEIVLSMDEAITNAVQETIHEQQISIEHENLKRDITIRYHIDSESFDSTIIDHGRGLDIDKMLQTIPDSKSENYHEQVFNYVKTVESKKLKVRLNGKEITLNGIGAGLKIILTFMDHLSIDLIDKKSILSTNVTNFTDGTILNMNRKRRY